jgi:hypothetical protein
VKRVRQTGHEIDAMRRLRGVASQICNGRLSARLWPILLNKSVFANEQNFPEALVALRKII